MSSGRSMWMRRRRREGIVERILFIPTVEYVQYHVAQQRRQRVTLWQSSKDRHHIREPKG